MNFVRPDSVENKYNLTSTSQQFPNSKNTGRVPNMSDPALQELAARQYSLYEEKPALAGSDMRQELIGNVHTATPLNTVFFSHANLDKLQQSIQDQVFAMSGNKHRIDRQNDDDVKLIMRSYYMMFGRNNPNTVASDLADLNARVVGYASAKIFSELDFYMFYRKDIEEFAPPIANPMNVHVFGTRYGELKSFF
uniref:Minor capsid protein P8 central region domain-containing protein n=1 Tax=viral metagenome TaxID=1070528 RepID=A0A6C0F2I6_9ZZZZ